MTIEVSEKGRRDLAEAALCLGCQRTSLGEGELLGSASARQFTFALLPRGVIFGQHSGKFVLA